MKLVSVRWLDIVTDNGWETLAIVAENFSPHEVESVGTIVAEDEDSITLASTFSTAGNKTEVNCRIAIPRGCVREIVELVPAVPVQ